MAINCAAAATPSRVASTIAGSLRMPSEVSSDWLIGSSRLGKAQPCFSHASRMTSTAPTMISRSFLRSPDMFASGSEVARVSSERESPLLSTLI